MKEKFSEKGRNPYDGLRPYSALTHAVGILFALAALAILLHMTISMGSGAVTITAVSIYAVSMLCLYTASTVYHSLNTGVQGRLFLRKLDHVMIYFLIAGTYTPILLCAIRRVSPATAWVLFGVVWGCAAAATVFTAIDLKRYAKLSMACYIGMGWCIVLAAKATILAIRPGGLWLLLAGGIAYTVGAVLYAKGKTHRYMHSVFHLFVVLGSLLHFFCVFFYVI